MALSKGPFEKKCKTDGDLQQSQADLEFNKLNTELPNPLPTAVAIQKL